MRGMVARLVADRSFGFIAGDDGQEYFFHQSALQGADFGDLAPGIALEFDVDQDPKGDRPGEDPRAVNVRLADDAVPAVDGEVLPREKTR
jgi:CspA family cold shock protein